jgi:formylglycine-generating enzyme required for sulfatase activity
VGAFWIGKKEVTWADWQTVSAWAVDKGYTDLANKGQGVGDNYPVTHVSWYDVVKWCNARSEKEGKTPVYRDGVAIYRTGIGSNVQALSSTNGYRLPSSREWEFAARGGRQTKGYLYSGGNNMEGLGWYSANASGTVHEVGKKQANELGIYDMSGNVSEWTDSTENEVFQRVFRGGSWYNPAEACEVSGVYNFGDAETGNNHFGFRVSLDFVP